MAGNKLIKIMQDASKPAGGETTDLLFGVVASVSPLKIKIDNRYGIDFSNYEKFTKYNNGYAKVYINNKLSYIDKEGNVRCRFGKDGLPILYYSGLNYEDENGKNPKLDGKFQPDRKLLIEDIKKLLEE